MAIASLTIGLIVLLEFGLQWLDLPDIESLLWESLGHVYSPLYKFIYPLFLFLVILGLILGILAYRRKIRSRIAIAGITLNSLVILYAIFFVRFAYVALDT